MLPAISNLTNLKNFLSRYPHNEAGAFEYLAASTFSQAFYLPFQSIDNEDTSVNHRVMWYGSVTNLKTTTKAASPAGSDSICFAYGFYVLIENTLRTGANQWRKEFIESLKHYDKFITDRTLDRKDVLLALIVSKLHNDTYTGFKQKVLEGYNIVLLESSWLEKVVEASKMISTVRHLDLRHLFNDMLKILRESTSFEKFRTDMNKSISEWQKDVLKREKTVFFGLKSYEAMRKVGRNIVGTSEILLNLNKDSRLNRYVQILGGDLTTYIKESLLSEKLAYLVTTPDEDCFCKVNCTDYKARGLRLIKEVEDLNATP